MLKLDNGLRILVLPDSSTPSISVGLWVGAGWVHNPRDREGLADICAVVCEQEVQRAFLTRGVGKRYLIDTFSAGVSSEHAGFAVTALAGDLDPALAVMREVAAVGTHGRATAPGDDTKDDEGSGVFAAASTLKRDALLNLLRNRFAPGLVAREALAAVLFGGQRPLGFSARFQTLLGLLPEHVRKFHRDYYRPDNAILTVDGAVQPEAVRAAAARRFGNWTATGKVEPPAWGRAASAPAHTGVTLIDHPDADHAVILGGLAGPGREDPDFPRMQLLHHVVGGKRVEDGLAALFAGNPGGYQFRSQLRVNARGSELTVEAVVPHELATQSLAELKRGIEDIAKSEIDSNAFAAEVQARSHNLAFRFETSAARMREAVSLLLAGQPLVAAEDPAAAVTGLDRKATIAQWRAWLQPERIVWVVLGRGDALTEKLTAAGIEHKRGDIYDVVTGRLFARREDPAFPLPGPAATVQAEELILAAIEAKGGFEAIERVGSYTVEDSLFVKPGQELVPGTRKLLVRFPDRYREELSMAPLKEQKVIQVVDGNDVWRNQLGRVLGASQPRRHDLLARQWLDGIRLFYRYGEPGANAFIIDPDVLGGVIVDGFQIVSPDGYWVRVYLHPNSRWVVKRGIPPASGSETTLAEEIFTDYRPVEGVFVPFIAASYLDGEFATESHVQTIDFNVPLKPDLFTRQEF
jgi:predicted Zn-dependent peptidase